MTKKSPVRSEGLDAMVNTFDALYDTSEAWSRPRDRNVLLYDMALVWLRDHGDRLATGLTDDEKDSFIRSILDDPEVKKRQQEHTTHAIGLGTPEHTRNEVKKLVKKVRRLKAQGPL